MYPVSLLYRYVSAVSLYIIYIYIFICIIYVVAGKPHVAGKSRPLINLAGKPPL